MGAGGLRHCVDTSERREGKTSIQTKGAGVHREMRRIRTSRLSCQVAMVIITTARKLPL